MPINHDPRDERPVFRFAPSPTGRLHLGHAFAALVGHDRCERAGGRFLLRIEDIDPERSRPEFEQAIYDDLAWLGLSWEEPVHRQSDHIATYRDALAALQRRGLAYPAFLSRRQVAARAAATPGWPADPDGVPHYPPDDRRLSADEAAARIRAGEEHGWRLAMDRAIAAAGDDLHWIEDGDGPADPARRVEARPGDWGDVLVARRDVPTSYHLAVVVDDALQGITHVVRGQDLFHATAVHVVLQRLFGYPQPVYHHHRLIADPAGRKLAKRLGDATIAALRDDGASPADIRRMVGL